MSKAHILDSIAFIESNTTGTGEEFIKSALRNNYKVLFLTSTPKKYSFIKKLLVHPIIIDTHDIEKIFNYLKDIPNLKGVISTSELFVYNASKVAQLLSLSCTNPESIQNCRNKFKLFEILSNTSLAKIRTKLINSTEECIIESKQLTLPAIVKPNFGTGSIGVKLCNSFNEIIDHVNTLKKNNHANQGILIQEYIFGEEFSAEVIALKNTYHLLGMTKKYLGKEPHFVEIGHEFPALIDQRIKDKIFFCITQALEAVGFSFGPAHIEFRLVGEEIYIIEINPRLAGGMIPILIEQSLGIKLIDGLIKLYTGQNSNFISKTSFVTKIEFFLPNHEGLIRDIQGLNKASNYSNIFNVNIYKAIGDVVTIRGDFSDRLGFIIAKSKSLDKCRKAILNARDYIKFEITPAINSEDSKNYGRDRLGVPLDPEVKQILELNSFSDLNELELLSDINKAHIIMLNKCSIISSSQLYLILKAIKEIEENNFVKVKEINHYGIGHYLAYEQCLVNMLGVKVAGTLHTGRSRNDINATITRLKSRHVFLNLYSAIWNLRSEILQVAADSLNIVMPIYSQYQPAMPGTYGYYLLAIENTLRLNQHYLKQAIDSINTSTLGAVSGAGTTFPINPYITAKLLGFDHISPNALSSVASRDLELMLLSSGAMIGVNISRIAQDYQIWSTQEFSFFDFANSLCGISSAMPQKKNPYLLEKVKGKAINISGKLFASLAIMHKTPFSNSLEVGTEALIGFEESFNDLIKATKLLELIIQGAKPIQSNMIKSNLDGLTVATAISEVLVVERNISFREAHGIVAQTIVQAINNIQDPLSSILSLDNISSDPAQWHLLFEYGNGPGKVSTELMLSEAAALLNSDALFLRSKVDKWKKANELLEKKIKNTKIVE